MKKISIADAMRTTAPAPSPVAEVPAPPPARTRARTKPPAPAKTQRKTKVAEIRQGAKVVSGFFDESVQYQLKVLAAEQRSTVQGMLEEALDLLFAQYRKPTIARTGRDRGRDKRR